MAQEKRLIIQGLKKSFGNRQIIKGIDLELYKGEIVGLIGPNGAGKSTTMKMLTGLISKSDGKIYYDNLDYDNSFNQIKEKIGAIIENPDLFPYLSGRDHMKLKAQLYPGTTKEDITQCVNYVEMQNAMDKKVQRYSLGMKQRLALATLLLAKPEFIILDEPFNGLDPKGIRDLRVLIRRLAEEQGVTVLVSSHILSEVEAMVDRVAFISQGEIVNVSDIKELGSVGSEDTSVKILCSNQQGLAEYFTFKNIDFRENKGYLQVKVGLEFINNLIMELIHAGFQIYSVELVHQSLEERFVDIMNQKGGAIQ